MWRAAAPFSTKKLNETIDGMERTIQRIERIADFVEKGEAQAERESAADERQLQKDERYVSSQWRDEQQKESKGRLPGIDRTVNIVNILKSLRSFMYPTG